MLARWRHCAMALIVAASASAGPALAVELDKKWEVGADLVWTIYANGSSLSDGDGWNVRGGYHFAPRHWAEANFTFETVADAERGSPTEFDVTRWAVNYVYDFKEKKPDSKIAPFILFGMGMMSVDDGSDSTSSTLFQAGSGMRVFFKPWLAMRFDGKLFRFHGGGDVIPNAGYWSFDVDLGVSFVFGKGA